MNRPAPTDAALGMSETLPPGERCLRSMHFWRQHIITQRKLVDSVNRRWCQNQLLLTKRSK